MLLAETRTAQRLCWVKKVELMYGVKTSFQIKLFCIILELQKPLKERFKN